MNQGSQGILKQGSNTLKSYSSLVNLRSHGADRGCYVVIESQVEGTHLKLTRFVVGGTNEVAVHLFSQGPPCRERGSTIFPHLWSDSGRAQVQPIVSRPSGVPRHGSAMHPPPVGGLCPRDGVVGRKESQFFVPWGCCRNQLGTKQHIALSVERVQKSWLLRLLPGEAPLALFLTAQCGQCC